MNTSTDRIKQIMNNVDWNSLILIFAFGSAGGLMYWFYILYDAQLSTAVPEPNFLWRWIVILPAVLMLGGFTALVGVFYITGNKPEDIPKAVVIAMVFGFSFNSVLQYLNESQSRALNLEQAENSTADLTKENARLKAELRERELPPGVGQGSEELVNIRAAQADQIIGGLKESTTSSAREKFASYSKELILDMQKSALLLRSESAVVQALRSLGQVGGQAVRVSDGVSYQALESIATVAANHVNDARDAEAALSIYFSADESLKEIAKIAREEGRATVAERAVAARVDLARPTVQRWHNRFSPRQRARMREHLTAARSSLKSEEARSQLDAALQELAGGAVRNPGGPAL
ncbi:MAG: hypothetical protein NXI24_24040 [bacterium]|nr:hypothetical protein [bacterium]